MYLNYHDFPSNHFLFEPILAGNTMLDENAMNDQTYQQIVSFLKTDKMSTFRFVIKFENKCVFNFLFYRSLKTAEDRVKFLYKHEAHWPLLRNIRFLRSDQRNINYSKQHFVLKLTF